MTTEQFIEEFRSEAIKRRSQPDKPQWYLDNGYLRISDAGGVCMCPISWLAWCRASDADPLNYSSSLFYDLGLALGLLDRSVCMISAAADHAAISEKALAIRASLLEICF